jgi:hypothetical protein
MKRVMQARPVSGVMKNEGVVMSLPLMSQVNAAASDRMHAERDAGRSALARRLRWRALFHVFYGEVPAVELHGLPGSAPSIASKIGAIVEMPMSSRPDR